MPKMPRFVLPGLRSHRSCVSERDRMSRLRRACRSALAGVAFAGIAGSASAQVLVANDDAYGVPFGGPLLVEAVGVLDNDTLDGENAGENGVTAELVSDVSHGALVLNPDGSFSYSPGASFDGNDAFVYRAVFGVVSSEAPVALSACTGGPQLFSCWKESAYLAMLAELGYAAFQESFEDDAAWGAARSPYTAPSVRSLGVRWQTNHPQPPASNEITTGSGPARTGLWGIFDPEHGYATGTPQECDVDVPDPHCLYHDGFTGVREAGRSALRAAGGYFTTNTYGANVAVVLDALETNSIGFGPLTNAGHQFFGVVDLGPGGFRRFEFREIDGKVGQALFLFGDDFTLAAESAAPIPALPALGPIALAALLALAAAAPLRAT